MNAGLMTDTPLSDSAAAAELATSAGELLLRMRGAGGAAGDAAGNDHLISALTARFPHDAVLSEEMADESDRLTNSRVWIIDPLDGTREYSEPPRDDWAVHVALVVDGKLSAGAVALPAQGITLQTGTVEPPPARAGSPRMLVSRTRPAALAVQVAEAIGAELVPMGSAGAKAMAVVLGAADVYLHTGGQWEWDSAAPVAVAAAAGLHVSRADGSPLIYNQPKPWLPDVLICRPELAPTVLAAHERLSS